MKKTRELDRHARKLFIIVSCDTEFDPPSSGGSYKNRTTVGLLDGLPRFLGLCEHFDASSTLFCEGKLVKELPDLFKELAAHHEIGCHSYAHEWLGTKPPPRWIPSVAEFSVFPTAVKSEIIGRAVASIESAIGKKPKSFKAPFNSIDHPSTLTILEKCGFDSDSSLPCYNERSFLHPLLAAPPRHTSTQDLWNDGTMQLVEVPYVIRPQPLLFMPTMQEVLDTLVRSPKVALEAVDNQCRMDAASGRDFTLLHVSTHPWEFSDIGPWGKGKSTAERLERHLNQVSTLYDTEFLTVSEFTRRWENEYCTLHARLKTGPKHMAGI